MCNTNKNKVLDKLLGKFYTNYCNKDITRCEEGNKVKITTCVTNWCKILQTFTYVQPNEEVSNESLVSLFNLIVKQIYKQT